MSLYTDYSSRATQHYAALLPQEPAPLLARRGPRYGLREMERIEGELILDRGSAIEDRIQRRLNEQHQTLLTCSLPLGDPAPVREMTQAHSRIVLTAGAGAGKTTALLDLAAHPLSENILTALVELPHLIASAQDLPAYLAADAKSKLSLDLTAEFFTEALNGGKILVCFDNLDAISDAAVRALAITKIEDWANQFPRARFIVTARSGAYEPTLNHNIFVHFTLQPWTGDTVAALEASWNTALDAWQVEGRIAKEPGYAERRLLWQHLALAMREHAADIVPAGQAQEWLAEAAEHDDSLKLNKRKAQHAAEMLITESVPLLGPLSKSDAGLSFSSRLLHDALAARALQSRCVAAGVESAWAKMAPYLWNVTWREPLVLTFRFLSQEQPALWAELMSRLLDAGEEDAQEPALHRHLLLAAAALSGSDASRLQGSTPKRIVDGLIAWLSDAQAAGRLDAVNALFVLEQVLDAAQSAVQLAQKAELDEWARQATSLLLSRLGHLCRAEAIAALQAVVDKKDESTLVRKAAALSIGQLLANGPADQVAADTQEKILAWIQNNDMPIDLRGVLVDALGAFLTAFRSDDLLEKFFFWACAPKDSGVWYTIQIAAARALCAMARLTDDAVIKDRLWELASNAEVDASVRIEIAATLGELGRTAEVVQMLRDLAVNTSIRYVEQQDAFKLLGRLGYVDPQAVETAKTVAQAPGSKYKDFVRLAAAHALTGLGEPALSMQLVLQLVADKSIYRSTRLDAFKIVGQMGLSGIQPLDEAAVAIMRVWAKEENTTEDTREQAMESLISLGVSNEGVAQDLIAVLQNKREYPRVRRKAAWALSKMPEMWSAPICEGLRAVLYDPDEQDDTLRVAISRTLLHFVEEEQAVTYLKAVTEEAYMATARHAAALALIEHGLAADAITPLLDIVTDTNIADNLRQSAARTLGLWAYGNDQVIQGMKNVLAKHEQEPNARQEVYTTLQVIAA